MSLQTASSSSGQGGQDAASATIAARRQFAQELRHRLVNSLTLYGVCLSAGAALIMPLTQARLGQDPQHVTGVIAVFTALSGATAALIFLRPILGWIGGYATEQRGVFIWLLIGLAFGLAAAFLTGALRPFAVTFIEAFRGYIADDQVLNQFVDSFLRAPLSSFTYGALASFPLGMIVGALFGVGGWAVDTLNRHESPSVRAYAPWALAVAAGGALFLFAAFGPVGFLSRLG